MAIYVGNVDTIPVSLSLRSHSMAITSDLEERVRKIEMAISQIYGISVYSYMSLLSLPSIVLDSEPELRKHMDELSERIDNLYETLQGKKEG